MNTRRAMAASAAYAIGWVALCATIFAVASPAMASAPRCQEDERCWVWSKMGDRHRGIVLKSNARVVVGPCAYRRYARAHRIDTANTEPLRGDAWAREHGCQR